MAFDVKHGMDSLFESVRSNTGMTRRCIASIAMGGLFMLVTGSSAAHDAPLLVEYLPSAEFDSADLSADQSGTLDAIRDDPAALDIRIGTADPDEARDTLALSLVLPGPPGIDSGATASFHDLNLEERSEQDYSLFFSDETSGSEVALVVLGPDVLGTIRYSGALYNVHPVGDGLTAVYRYDTSRLPPPATLGEPVANKRRQRDAVPRSAGVATTDESPVIDILVTYTRAARIQAGNIDALIRFAFDQTNRAYANSLARPRVRLVHSYQTEYVQEDEMLIDLERLQAPADLYMDEAHARRDEYAADVVVLLVGKQSDRCRVTYISPREAYAFTVVAQSCIGGYAFPESLGYLHGAAPDLATRTNTFFSYGHGFCNDSDNWRTVMARNQDHRCPVPIPYFSNPDVSYAGTPTGDAELRNNARVINETAERIAAFRQPLTPARSFLIPLFIPADDLTQQGFARITNRSYRAGTVTIHAIDDTGQRFGPVSLALARRASGHFNSGDLEEGNPEKGLSAGIGDGSGNWRLELDTDLDIGPRAYIRTSDGFLTSIHEVAGRAGLSSTRYHVPIFNPASNPDQQSRLRLVNPGEDTAGIVISGFDDEGEEPPEGRITLALETGAALMLSAQELEAGGDGFTGRFGDGTGKWQLIVSSNRPIVVMSLLQSPTGNLTNLSP